MHLVLIEQCVLLAVYGSPKSSNLSNFVKNSMCHLEKLKIYNIFQLHLSPQHYLVPCQSLCEVEVKSTHVYKAVYKERNTENLFFFPCLNVNIQIMVHSSTSEIHLNKRFIRDSPQQAPQFKQRERSHSS